MPCSSEVETDPEKLENEAAALSAPEISGRLMNR